MRGCLLAAALLCITFPSLAQERFTTRTVVDQLEIPWEIEWGPDSMLWVTERPGIFSRIDPVTGRKDVMLDDQARVHNAAECGMLGFDWHPDYPDSPYIYVAAVYGSTRPEYRTVDRYTVVVVNDEHDTLVDQVEIFRESPVNYSHQGCRIKVGPERKLWVTTGENAIQDGLLAQDTTNNLGKVLRMELDGSVPDNNPYPGRLFYTYGHRNVQGLVHMPNGNIFTAEHGNNIEDEVNLLKKGANYGWPYVEGPCDEDYEMEFCQSHTVQPPTYTSGNRYTYAMSALEYYDHERYPSLRGSLLLATLKWAVLFQLQMDESLDKVTGVKEHIQRSIGRIRDIAISPDGRIFLCTSNRENLARQPFPLPGDDRIVELVPEADGVRGKLTTPDTVRVFALPGDEMPFYAPITNVGTGPVMITEARATDGWPYIVGQHWTLPFIVNPDVTYKVHMLFSPPEPGIYHGTMHVEQEDGTVVTAPVVGSTYIGYLTCGLDTVFMDAEITKPSTIDVVYHNNGLDTVLVDSFFVTDDYYGCFSIVKNHHGPVSPKKSCTITLQYDPPTLSMHACNLKFSSDSYKHETVLVIGAGRPVSVHEDDAARPLTAYPNPFSGHVVLAVEEIPSGTVAVHDLLGNTIWEAAFEAQSTVTWNGRDMAGASTAPGAYIVVLTSPHGMRSVVVQKME